MRIQLLGFKMLAVVNNTAGSQSSGFGNMKWTAFICIILSRFTSQRAFARLSLWRTNTWHQKVSASYYQDGLQVKSIRFANDAANEIEIISSTENRSLVFKIYLKGSCLA